MNVAVVTASVNFFITFVSYVHQWSLHKNYSCSSWIIIACWTYRYFKMRWNRVCYPFKRLKHQHLQPEHRSWFHDFHIIHAKAFPIWADVINGILYDKRFYFVSIENNLFLHLYFYFFTEITTEVILNKEWVQHVIFKFYR